MPKYQLTYLTFTDKERWLGHACVGISKICDDGTRELIFRVGLFPTNQVQMEDFIKNKPGRNFKEKSFDIDEEQLLQVLKKINSDRQKESESSSLSPQKPESKNQLYSGEKSTPGGPDYHWRNHNCKDYALSLVKAAGIDEKQLKNTGISIPYLSGNLRKVILVPKENGVIILKNHDESASYISNLLSNIIKSLLSIYKNNALEKDPTSLSEARRNSLGGSD